MNEKAIESMTKDEPETSLEYLKKVNDTLQRMEAAAQVSSTHKKGH